MPKGVYRRSEASLIHNRTINVGRTPWNKGLKYLSKMSNESRKKRSEEMKGNKHNPGLKGELSPNWKGGKTNTNTLLRSTYQQRNWRMEVFKRDNYTCQKCFKRGGQLNADHIKPFAYFPELRTVLENGRTLCVSCHKNTNTYAGRISKSYEVH